MTDEERKKVSNYVDIRPLKRWASRNLPESSSFREIILMEDDELSKRDFLAKLPTWMRIFNQELKQREI